MVASQISDSLLCHLLELFWKDTAAFTGLLRDYNISPPSHHGEKVCVPKDSMSSWFILSQLKLEIVDGPE